MMNLFLLLNELLYCMNCHRAISFILFRGKVFILYKFLVLQRFPCSTPISTTKKTPETLEVFPKETFTSLMVVLQSSKSLNLCLDSSRKIM